MYSLASKKSPGVIKREVSWTLTKKLDAFASPGEIKRRVVSWTLTKKLDALMGPGEIKRREVSWTLTKKLDAFAGPGEIKRKELVLDPQVSPKEIKSREVELGLKDGLLSFQLFPNGGATDIVFVTLFCIAVGTAIAWCGGRCAMPDGHCRNILLFWRGPRQPWSSGLTSVSRFHSSVPLFPLVPVPNRPTRLRGR